MGGARSVVASAATESTSSTSTGSIRQVIVHAAPFVPIVSVSAATTRALDLGPLERRMAERAV
jgi:hypothetical protein